MKIKSHRFTIFAFIFLGIFALGSIENYFESSYVSIKDRLSIFIRTLVFNYSDKNFSKCSIPEISSLYEGSTIIVGHAYGSPLAGGSFISKNLQEYINLNKKKIKTIIFSGDVFSVPTKYKWERLEDFIGNNIDSYLAPGNHDVGLSDGPRRDIFKQSFLSRQALPLRITRSGYTIVIEDSVKTNWKINKNVINLLNTETKDLPTILVRHNIAIKEMVPVANSKAGYTQQLHNLNNLANQINSKLVIISGDGGAHEFLPRIYCRQHKNLKFIVNGLGETLGDTIIVLHEGMIYKQSLN